MLSWELPAIGGPFEIWREDPIMRLAFRDGARVGVPEMKQIVRLARALDPHMLCPVLVECGDGVVITMEARALLCRLRVGAPPAVGCFTTDLDCRLQGELFKRLHRPAFAFRVFGWREEAYRWLRERHQLSTLGVGG